MIMTTTGTLVVPFSQLSPLVDSFLTAFPKGGVFALEGELGTGKTTFTRLVVERLYRDAGKPAPRLISPTFVIHQRYEGGSRPVDHFDLYRLDALTVAGALELGVEEAIERSRLTSGLVFIEWASRLGDLSDIGVTHRIELEFGSDVAERIFRFSEV